MIRNYDDFIRELLGAGFTIAGGGNDENVFGLIKTNWNDDSPDNPIRWFTGDPDTDPWEWRIRVLNDRDDVAYSKLFFKKAGFITKKWYPLFLAARREGYTFEDEYADGAVSHYCKRIYDVVAGRDSIPVHEIKRFAGFSRNDKSKFDGAIVELQTRMYITICGQQRKLSHKGELYSWPSSVYCTTERFWGEAVFEEADSYGADEAADAIMEQILKLNPSADIKKADKFIRG